MTVAEEKRNKTISFSITVALHILLLLCCFFVWKWYPPDPPLPDYGVELNFGLDEAGYGDLQTTAPPSDATSTEDAIAGNPETEQTTETAPSEETSAENVEANNKTLTTDNPESPIAVPEEPKETKPKKESKPETARAGITNENGAGGRNGKSNQTPGNNNGDKPGTVGDQGDPNGSLDAKALYGKAGKGGSGSSLQMTGWAWDDKPNVQDKSSEEGKIVFEIKVDDSGTIINVTTLESTVSPAVEKLYKKEVENLTFSRTRDNVTPAPISTGKITFIIKSK
ncbi:protein TonB, links inner and outer membranes [Flexibacter flexilis DSM 6793]|uniref:Protein TonB, links inner and outer membranes n=1 Tax=Flexibacter flexilis DSM 6793 TaxID=927664 RepID=A0A1I1HPZ9_9BACT|nr:hypothetical protein [Flexibacter flexilis]SFC25652.1 protein TonB, links inner and outer membranes [Flexibacter flexilis DSM 6793]